jgi:hypothetical protein
MLARVARSTHSRTSKAIEPPTSQIQCRDLPALMKLGGWKSEKMVLRYAHVNVAHLAQSIAALPWEEAGKPP